MDMYLPKVKGEEFFQISSTDVDEVGEWFKPYDIDSMELEIGSVIDTAETTALSRFQGRKWIEGWLETKAKDD
jgi:hypothetical protein